MAFFIVQRAAERPPVTISCELKISWLFPALMSIFTVWQSSFVCKFLINCVLCLDLWPCWLSFLWSYLCTVCLYDGRHSLRQNGWACCCYWWCCCWLLLTCNCTSIWPNFNQWARWKGKCTHNNTRRKYIMSPIRLVFFVNRFMHVRSELEDKSEQHILCIRLACFLKLYIRP